MGNPDSRCHLHKASPACSRSPVAQPPRMPVRQVQGMLVLPLHPAGHSVSCPPMGSQAANLQMGRHPSVQRSSLSMRPRSCWQRRKNGARCVDAGRAASASLKRCGLSLQRRSTDHSFSYTYCDVLVACACNMTGWQHALPASKQNDGHELKNWLESAWAKL